MMEENIDIHSILPTSPTTSADPTPEEEKALKTPKDDVPVLKSIREESKEEETAFETDGGEALAAESLEDEFGEDNQNILPVPLPIPAPVQAEPLLVSATLVGKETRSMSTVEEEEEKLRKPSISASNKDAVNKAKVAADERKKDTRTNDLITKEERQIGNVAWPLYSYYIKAGGLFWFSGMVFFVVIGQLFQLLANYWLQW
jgi:hypothetical protein